MAALTGTPTAASVGLTDLLDVELSTPLAGGSLGLTGDPLTSNTADSADLVDGSGLTDGVLVEFVEYQPDAGVGLSDAGHVRDVADALTDDAVDGDVLVGTYPPGTPPPSVPESEYFELDADVLAGGMVWLYGMQEQGNARTAGDVSGAPGRPALSLTRTNDTGEVTFGQAGLMPEGVAVQFSPAADPDTGLVGGYTLGSGSVQAYLGAEWTVWLAFAWAGGASSVRLLQLGPSAAGLRILATPSAVIARWGNADGAYTQVSRSMTTNDNAPHMVVVTMAGSGLSLSTATGTTTATADRGLVGTVTGLTVGDSAVTAAHQVAWVGYANTARTPAQAVDLANLGSGGSERSDERVRRICRWVGVDFDLAAEVGLSDVTYSNAGGSQALDLIHAVNAMEDGVFFPSGDGRLVQHSRSHRYGSPVRLALDASQVGVDTAVQVDLTRVVNDLTVTGPTGATARVRDQASISAYGERSRWPGAERSASLTLLAASDDDVTAAAGWRLNRYAHPLPRIPAVTVNLLPMTATEAAAVLALEVGDRIQVTGMPATTPGGSTVDLAVEGVEEQVSATSWTVTLATSPWWPVQVGYVDAAELDDVVLAY